MQDEFEAVHRAVLDYAEGWYLSDPERVERALHPTFLKRRATGDGFETSGRQEMLDFIDDGIGFDPDCDITIIVDDVAANVASARCYSCLYLDLVHLGRFEDGWKLVHSYYRHLNEEE